MLKAFSVTDIGKKRQMNQDFVFASRESVGNLPNLFLVADGMGGHNAGDYASKYTVETIVDDIRSNQNKDTEGILKQAIMKANAQIRERAKEKEELWGMGTTVVAATCEDGYLEVANVGDSRLYIVNDTIRQITRDHSLVEELVRLGELTPELARTHKDKNIITRAIGATEKVEIDFFREKLLEKDLVLMCSDGLTNMLEDREIIKILKEENSLDQKAGALIKAANKNGGRDNIAVILISPYGE